MTTYAAEVLADAPILYFQCNETSGTATTDATGNGHTGNLTNTFTVNQLGMSSATAGAIAFNGGQVTVPASAAFKVQADYTIEMVASWTSSVTSMLFGALDLVSPYPGPTVLVSYSQQANGDSAGKIVFRDEGNVNYALEFGGGQNQNYNDNKFRHFCFVRRGLVIEAWVNGSLIASKVLPALANQANTNPIYIMGQPTAQFLSGALDEVAFYAKALDPSRIALHARLAADLRRIAGNAKLDGGAAAALVVARNWATHAHVGQATPASNGDFEIWVPQDQYDVTVFGPSGYQPVTHGPVTASTTA